jgi:DNA polymerase-3 subunit gamma/tau
MLDAAALRRLWPEILDVVKRTSRRTRALLDSAQIVAVDRDLVQLSAPAALARMIAEQSNTAALARALTDVVGSEWRVEVKPAEELARSNGTAGNDVGNGAGTPSAPAAADPGQDPDEVDDAVESSAVAPSSSPADPEAAALKLLQEHLGARPLEQS